LHFLIASNKKPLSSCRKAVFHSGEPYGTILEPIYRRFEKDSGVKMPLRQTEAKSNDFFEDLKPLANILT